MFKWIALGLGAYLLFGKKALTEAEKAAAAAAAAAADLVKSAAGDAPGVVVPGVTSDGPAATYIAPKPTKLENQAMPIGSDMYLQEIPPDDPPKIHSVIKYGNGAAWNYYTKAGGKANLTYILDGATPLLDTGKVYEGWLLLDPTQPNGYKWEK
jgi:hypothetical protein